MPGWGTRATAGRNWPWCMPGRHPRPSSSGLDSPSSASGESGPSGDSEPRLPPAAVSTGGSHAGSRRGEQPRVRPDSCGQLAETHGKANAPRVSAAKRRAARLGWGLGTVALAALVASSANFIAGAGTARPKVRAQPGLCPPARVPAYIAQVIPSRRGGRSRRADSAVTASEARAVLSPRRSTDGRSAFFAVGTRPYTATNDPWSWKRARFAART